MAHLKGNFFGGFLRLQVEYLVPHLISQLQLRKALAEALGVLKTHGSTWRIIPGLGYVVNNHGDHKSPKDRVVVPLPNGLNGL